MIKQRFSCHRIHSVLGLFCLLVSCQKAPDNTRLPKPPNSMTQDDVSDPVVKNANQRWNALAAQLQLLNDGTEEALWTSSAFFAQTSQGLTALAQVSEALINEHLKSATATTCAGVDSFERLGKAKSIGLDSFSPSDIDSADWYLMKYKRRKGDGSADNTLYGALVSIPTSTQSTFPVIAYAHAGDRGLSVLEIAAVFADLQASHIIVAPAFPGEPICKFGTSSSSKISCDSNGRFFDAVGVSDPYSSDAEDLLAAHNCIVSGHLHSPLTAQISGRIKTQTLSGGAPDPVPVSYMFGSSRGGLTTNIALAKNAAMLTANARAERTVYSEAKYFNCAGTIINPTTFTYGEFRIYLESVAKGTATATSFFRLPTAPQLNDLLNDYREERINAADAALLLKKRDGTFNAALTLSSVRNWSTGGRGSFLTLHGTLDRLIPISQGQFGGQILRAVNQSIIDQNSWSATKTPGVHLTTLGTLAQAPYSSDGGQTLKSSFTMHGDLAWFNSLTAVDTSKTESQRQPVKLDANNPFIGKKPIETFAAWMKNTETGCAAATP